MNNALKRILIAFLSAVLALGMCPAAAFAAPADVPATPDALEAPQALEATASQDGPQLAANADGKVKIHKTMTAYNVDINGSKTLVASSSGPANETRDCGQAGYCQLVAPSDGSEPTTFPQPGALEAFTLGCGAEYRLTAFNVTYTDAITGEPVKMTLQNGGLTRLGAYSYRATMYEFVVPDADDISVNAVWERQAVAISKSLTWPSGTTSESQCRAGTCEMVATQSGIPATKFPAAGNQTAFKITTERGYKLAAFSVTFTTEIGGLNKLTQPNGLLTRVGDYKPSSNTYEFYVPLASDICVNVTWVRDVAPGSVVASGSAGGGVTWELSTDGVLRLGGAGCMDSYDNPFESRPPYVVASKVEDCPITKVQVGEGVAYVSPGAFAGLDRLASFSVAAGNERYISPDGRSLIDPGSGNSMIRDSCIVAYAPASGSEYVIPSTVYFIDPYAFAGCAELMSIRIPPSVTGILRHAFDGCVGLTEVSLPWTFVHVSNDAFANCTNLATAYVGVNADIDPNAFPETCKVVRYQRNDSSEGDM